MCAKYVVFEAQVSLDHLIENSKSVCFEKIKTTDDVQLWNVFREVQTNLFFDSEFNWISKGNWWLGAKNVLELGSGNGPYLNKLCQKNQVKAIEMKSSPLAELFEVDYSNLDLDGNVIGDVVRFEGEKDKALFFNQNILFVELLHRTYQIPVDLNKTWNELQAYLIDENAWTSPGVHFLVLKKKNEV
ncbi:MAG: hypothetical protein S4CHLAM7_01210 [Chlamydiae bacterium]|nr:hypothetical protein [Chlamydiota bacterium]